MVKVTREVHHQRVNYVMVLRARGASFADVRAWTQTVDPETGRPWHLSEGGLRRYITAADKAMREYREENRERLLDRHLAIRQTIYKQAMDNGALETALAAAKDSARLQGVYPDEGGKGQAPPTGPQQLTILVDLRTLPADAREQAIAQGAAVDPRQLADLPADELIRLHLAAMGRMVKYTSNPT